MSSLFPGLPALERLPLPDGELWLQRALPLGRPPEEVLDELLRTLAWKSETIVLWGKRYRQPRLLAWYGDAGAGYRYSGTFHEPLVWTPLLLDLRVRVEAATGERFNSVLANLYRDGSDSMGMHADDEPELGPEPVIASLSLGETRTFVLRHRVDRTQKARRLELESGSLLVMKGTMQRFWKHGLPKEKPGCGPRVNLTFRRVLEARR